jgi:hypothetical protein
VKTVDRAFYFPSIWMTTYSPVVSATAGEEARYTIVSAPISGDIAKSLASHAKLEIEPPLSSPI